ncbi:hypothetical protein ACCS68_29140 [Rhizobium beringeri]|uniref:hypothetical protein n=1 Tax=Rhizobium TaxID=379 RepID=UPI00103071A1|nr:hypothetical protein [Rhizobium leguminosarum]TAW53258.1 hypothetical protein ELI14_19125 [Rhizobium leguminosarum]
MAAIGLLVADIARLRASLAYLIGTMSAFWFAQIAGFGQAPLSMVVVRAPGTEAAFYQSAAAFM